MPLPGLACMNKWVKNEVVQLTNQVKNRKCEESCSRGDVRRLCYQEIEKSR